MVLRVLIQKLWSRDVGRPGYLKSDWMELERGILDLQARITKLESEQGRK